jgi:hypothetical protein
LNGKMGGARGKIKPPRDNGHVNGNGHSGIHGNGRSPVSSEPRPDKAQDRLRVAAPPASSTELVSSDGRLRVL